MEAELSAKVTAAVKAADTEDPTAAAQTLDLLQMQVGRQASVL